MRFAMQGDVHSFHRVPRDYLVRLTKDAGKSGINFLVLLGDTSDGGAPAVMGISRESPIPALYMHGDHEFFGEWSEAGCAVVYERRKLLGGAPDPLIFAIGGVPRCEAWAGLPRFWSFSVKGLHFVIAFNGKHEVWPIWFLRWVRRDLEEHRDLTTIIFSHRGIEEVGTSPAAMRMVVEEFHNIKLFCRAHSHAPTPFRLWQSALEVNAEIPYKGRFCAYKEDCYGVVEVSPEGLRVLKKSIGKEGFDEECKSYRTETRLSEVGRVDVSFPFLMPDGGVAYVFAVWLRKARLRVFGVENEQLAPDPFLESGKVPWEALNGAELSIVRTGGGGRPFGLRDLGLERAVAIRVRNFKGSPEKPVPVCRFSVPIKFNEVESGEGGSLSGGTVYDALVLAEIPQGRKLRLIVEGLLPDGSVESRHFVDIPGSRGLSVGLAKMGCILIPAVGWRWVGFEGHTYKERMPRPRRGTRLRVVLAVPEEVEEAEYRAVIFVYPHEGFYVPIRQGRQCSEDVVVEVGGRTFEFGDLRPGEFKEVGDVPGGAEVRLHCRGSRLALVELRGEADALMLHLLRKVREEKGGFALGEPTPLGEELLSHPLFREQVGITGILALRPIKVNGRLLEPLQWAKFGPKEEVFLRPLF